MVKEGQPPRKDSEKSDEELQKELSELNESIKQAKKSADKLSEKKNDKNKGSQAAKEKGSKKGMQESIADQLRKLQEKTDLLETKKGEANARTKENEALLAEKAQIAQDMAASDTVISEKENISNEFLAEKTLAEAQASAANELEAEKSKFEDTGKKTPTKKILQRPFFVRDTSGDKAVEGDNSWFDEILDNKDDVKGNENPKVLEPIDNEKEAPKKVKAVLVKRSQTETFKEQEQKRILDEQKAVEEETKKSEEIAKKVEKTRETYLKEYKKCKNEVDRLALIDKTRNATFNILAGVKNIFSKNKVDLKKSIKIEDYFTKETIEAKTKYYEARKEMGNAMFEQKKAALEKEGLSGKDLDEALTKYKATEILAKTIIDERQKLIDSKEKPIEPALWKKMLDKYMSIQPRWKKIALSTALFTAAAGLGIVGGGIFAGYGLVGMATMKFGTSMAMGMVVGHSVKGIDLIKRNSDLKFKTDQENSKDNLQNQFAQGQINMETYEKEIGVLEKAEKSRDRNRMLVKAGVGVAIAAIGGFYAYDHLGNGIDQLTGAHHQLGSVGSSITGHSGEHLAPGHGVLREPEDIKIIPHASVEAVANHGHGAIATIRDLQHNLKAEYGNNLDNAPASVKHILNTDADKLAREYGMYKPGQDAESAMIKAGSTFRVDGNGNVVYHVSGGQTDLTLEKGIDAKGSETFHGKMFDSDHSGVHPTNSETIPQYSPTGAGDDLISQYDPTTGLREGEIPQYDPDAVQPRYVPTYDSNHLNGTHVRPNLDQDQASEHLTGRALRHLETANKYQQDIHHIFPKSNGQEVWKVVKGLRADDMYGRPDYEVQAQFKPLYSYLHKLHDVTDLKPRGSSLFSGAETNEHYIERALRKAARIGKLNEVKL